MFTVCNMSWGYRFGLSRCDQIQMLAIKSLAVKLCYSFSPFYYTIWHVQWIGALAFDTSYFLQSCDYSYTEVHATNIYLSLRQVGWGKFLGDDFKKHKFFPAPESINFYFSFYGRADTITWHHILSWKNNQGKLRAAEGRKQQAAPEHQR